MWRESVRVEVGRVGVEVEECVDRKTLTRGKGVGEGGGVMAMSRTKVDEFVVGGF